MTVKDVWNRGNNLVGTTIVALSGFGFFGEFISETEWSHKLDELVMLVLGIIGIIWYFVGANRWKRSFAPVLLVLLALADKIMAIVLEMGDAEDLGDDFGGLVLLLLGSILMIWLYVKSKNVEEK